MPRHVIPEALRALRDERLVSLRLDVTDTDQIRAAGEKRLQTSSPSSTTPAPIFPRP